MPELQHQGSSRLLTTPGSSASTAAGGGLASGDDSVAGLASSFKDKVKIEKKHGTSENKPDQKRKVTVDDGGKIKNPGGKGNKKPNQTGNLVRPNHFYLFFKLKRKKPQ